MTRLVAGVGGGKKEIGPLLDIGFPLMNLHLLPTSDLAFDLA